MCSAKNRWGNVEWDILENVLFQKRGFDEQDVAINEGRYLDIKHVCDAREHEVF